MAGAAGVDPGRVAARPPAAPPGRAPAAGVETAYGHRLKRLKRLTTLKDRYDPTNLFRLNANIPPSRGRR